MRKTLLILFLMTGMMSCGMKSENAVQTENSVNDHVEVIYFHGKQRCATCMAIEKNARETVNTLFADELKNGKLIFKTVDISTPEGETLADRYEVTWSALFVNSWKNNQETCNNMTEFSFGNARNNPDRFRKGLADKIHQALK